MNPKTLQVFLMDGAPTGRLKCSLDNWTGLVYVVPRTSLGATTHPAAFETTGVYALLGQEADSGDDAVYIGQAVGRANGNGMLGRIREHVANGHHDFWNRAVLFSTLGDTFGPTEVTYLENHFHQLAQDASRYRVDNSQTPSRGNVTEEKEAELREYAAKARLVLSALGHRVFEPVDDIRIVETSPDRENALFTLTLRDALATGRPTSDGFVVLQGSSINTGLWPSAPAAVKANRERFKDQVDGNRRLTEDLLFTSSSAAAGFIAGGSMSGPAQWLAPYGRTLGEYEASAQGSVSESDLADL